MDITVNSDFTQVETDDQHINLTRFSLFFPEKRMYFLEQASIYDIDIDGDSNLFYSRCISLCDQKDESEPFWI